jgi:hypothetical protein
LSGRATAAEPGYGPLEPAGDHLSLPRGFRYEVLDQTGDPNPRTGIVYMTEDDTPAGFYRFVPRDSNDLTVGGTLQILAVQGQPGYDTRKHQTAGRDLGTTWVTIADPDPDVDGGGPTARVLSQGVAAGGAVFDYLGLRLPGGRGLQERSGHVRQRLRRGQQPRPGLAVHARHRKVAAAL